MTSPHKNFETGFESHVETHGIKHRKGEPVLAERSLGGPRTTAETDDIVATIREAEAPQLKKEMAEANAVMRNRRRNAERKKRYNADREELLSRLMPNDMKCLLCGNEKLRRSQWVVKTVQKTQVAMCMGCARRLRNMGLIK